MSFHVKPLNFWEKLADFLMTPVMYLLAGTFSEKPQQTHKWNNKKLSKKEIGEIDKKMTQKVTGTDSKTIKNSGIRFHCPIFGGWREYVVFCPIDPEVNEWYIGWHCKEVTGISRINISGSVRVLVGSKECFFFGVSMQGNQIPIYIIGKGKIGKKSPFSKLPLV